MFRILSGKLLLVAAAGVTLSACTQTEIRLEPDFGSAVVQDTAAQIADPDARYAGIPAPGSSGPRTVLAQHRYDTDRVVPPSRIGATGQGEGSGFDNGASQAGPGGGMTTSSSGP